MHLSRFLRRNTWRSPVIAQYWSCAAVCRRRYVSPVVQSLERASRTRVDRCSAKGMYVIARRHDFGINGTQCILPYCFLNGVHHVVSFPLYLWPPGSCGGILLHWEAFRRAGASGFHCSLPLWILVRSADFFGAPGRVCELTKRLFR